MGILKDQLEKLGLKGTSNSPATSSGGKLPASNHNTHQHQQQQQHNHHNHNHHHAPSHHAPHTMTRSFCEACERPAPDVELYNHLNKVIRAKWMCTRCADRFAIHDDFRRTAQSDFSKRRAFRREYGPTHSWHRLKSIIAEMEGDEGK